MKRSWALRQLLRLRTPLGEFTYAVKLWLQSFLVVLKVEVRPDIGGLPDKDNNVLW